MSADDVLMNISQAALVLVPTPDEVQQLSRGVDDEEDQVLFHQGHCILPMV